MKKFNKFLTVLVAFAMIASSFTMFAIRNESIHVHAAQTEQAWFPVFKNGEINTDDFTYSEMSSVNPTADVLGGAPITTEASGTTYRGGLTATGIGTSATIPLLYTTADGKAGAQVTGGRRTVIMFTAPKTETYTLVTNVTLLEPKGAGTGTYENWQQTTLNVAVEGDDDVFTVGTEASGFTSGGVTQAFTRTFELTEGQRVALIVRSYTNATIQINDLSFSYEFEKEPTELDYKAWDLKPDLSSATQGQFSFIFATDRPQTYTAPEVPTVSDGVLKNTEGNTMFFVQDGKIHANSYHSSVSDTWGIVFTAPEDGIYYYSISWNLSPTNDGSWNNKWIYNPVEGWKWERGTAINGNTVQDSNTIELKAGERIIFSVTCAVNSAGVATTAINSLSIRGVERIDANNFDSVEDNFSFLYLTATTHAQLWGSTASYVFDYDHTKEVRAVFSSGTSLVTKTEATGLGEDGDTPMIFKAGDKLRIEDKFRNDIVRFTAPIDGTYKMILKFNLLDLDPAKNEKDNFNLYFFAGNEETGYDVVRDAGGKPLQYAAKSNDIHAFEATAELEAGDNISALIWFSKWILDNNTGIAADFVSIDIVPLEIELPPCEHTGGNATCNTLAVCDSCGEAYGEFGDHNFANGTCTACGDADPDYVAPTPSFSAGISATPTDVSRGGSTTVKVTVDGTVYEKFASGELEVAFDADKFDFVSAKLGATELSCKVADGKVTVGFYGVENEFGTTIDLTFTAKNGVAIGSTATFTLTSAAFSDAMSAAASDLVAATITTATATTTIVAKTFTVTFTSTESGLADLVMNATGNTSVTEEQAFVITLPDGYDRFTWTVTVGENTYTDIVDGKITIPATEATADYTVAIERVSKTFNVTANVPEGETFNGNATADFGVDYTFSVPVATLPDSVTGNAGVSYSAAIVYTGTETAVAFTTATVDGRVVYTIAGADITADITVTITKTVTAVNQFTVTVNGFGADVSGNETTTVNEGMPFSFTITPITGYTYSVTAEGAEIVKDGNTYTIASVTANVTVTVTRTVNTEGVAIYSYLDLNGKTVYAITVNTTLADGYGYTYDGNAMFYNAATNEYVYLVIVDGAFTVEAAKALVSIKAGAETVTYNADGVDFDVNVTGTVDANDAQLVYNMYSSKTYDSFEVASMLKFLLADVNCDHSVNVDDAAKIINILVGAE